MGSRKFRLGRHRKNAELKRQSTGKKKPGRPRKYQRSQTKPTPSPESTPSQQTAVVPAPQSPMTLQMLYESLPTPMNQSWTVQYSDENKQLQLCKLSTLPSTSCQMSRVTHTLCVQEDLTWHVFIHGNKLHQISDTPLSVISSTLSPLSLLKLISILDEACVCPGNPDSQFLPMAAAHKGVFMSGSAEEKAHIEKDFQVVLNGQSYNETIRTTTCSLLVGQGKCGSCRSYRPQLRAMYSRWSKKPAISAKYTNNRYLNTPQKKKKMKELQVRAYTAEKEVKNLKERIEQCAEQKGVQIQPSLNEDFLAIMTEKNSEVEKCFPEGSFRRLFWDQQFQAAKTKDARQMRWHPCMIRWCLNLKLLSSAAYHSLRTSGFLKLPSERLLRDYTHFIKSKPGFSSELDQLLADESQVKTLPEWKRHVVLVLDEMKVKESLVFDKHETKVVGFVDMGDVNNELADLERECSTTEQHPAIATHMLVLMVRGVFTGLRFPYAHFPTTNIKAEQLFDIVWETIERLEHMKFKVIVVCADGASTNRKMFRMHGESLSSEPYNPVYKTTNIYSEEQRPLFFMSDVPHLLKTVRNNWSHSFSHGHTRKLWVGCRGHTSICTFISVYAANLFLG